jgi:hypothetical protein
MYHGRMESSTAEVLDLRKHCPAAFYRPNVPAKEEWILDHGGMPGTKSTGDAAWFETDKRIRVGIGGNRAGKTTKLILECGSSALGFRPWYPPSSPWFTRNLWTVAAKKRGYSRIRYVVPSFEVHLPEVVKEFREWWPASWWSVDAKTPQGQPRSFRFLNGSEIMFMSHHMKQEDFEGVEEDLVAFDEPPPEWMWSRILRGLVSTGGWTIVGSTLLDASGWFWDAIVNRAVGGQSEDIAVTWHSIWDNTAENGGCQAQTAANVRMWLENGITSPEERMAREHGYPMHVGGLVLSGFPMSAEVAPFELPSDCIIASAIDPAGSRPFAGLHIAYVMRDDEWTGYIFDETYLEQMKNDLGAFAEVWNNKEKGETFPRHPAKSIITLIDPFAEEPQKADVTGRSMRQILDSEYGIKTVCANRTGKRARLLQLNARVKMGRYKIFSNCKRILMERRRWTWDQNSPKLTRGEDDLCDCWTYIDAADPQVLFKLGTSGLTGGVWIPPEYREKQERRSRQENVIRLVR